MPKSHSPGFDPSILRHSGIWRVADGAVLNTVHRRKIQIPLADFFLDENCAIIQSTVGIGRDNSVKNYHIVPIV